jgi:homeobox protein cut-like
VSEDESEKDDMFANVPLASLSDLSTLQKIIDPTAPPLPVSLPSPDVSNTTPKKGKTKEHSVATIVIAQRDKLRKRCDVLEVERGGLKKELQMQVSMADSLKSDNTKLL